MAILVLLFLGISALVWLSTLGYLLAIGAAVLLKRQCGGGRSASPPIAVVIPTLNEAQTIAQKLDDIEQCDYPGNRRSLVVVDGGSTDKTPDLVQEKIAEGARITLVRLTESRGKVDQVNHALRHVKEGIIIFTDADSQLDRACVRALVRRLVDEPQTTLVGATVRPRSRLAEEHVHWCLLNYLWWLEGEVFSCAGLSGVCYGVNRNALLALAEDAKAEDIHLGLWPAPRACASGSPGMRFAHELRVPQTVREFLRFRRRRGASYMNEVVHFPCPGEAPVRWRIARLIRLWQFAGYPGWARRPSSFPFRSCHALLALGARSRARFLPPVFHPRRRSAATLSGRAAVVGSGTGGRQVSVPSARVVDGFEQTDGQAGRRGGTSMINGRHVTSGWHFVKHYFREVRPYEVTAQLWNVCDQKCVYCRCPAVSTATLTTAQWCEALRDLATLGTLRVKFQGGEPTLRPDFREISQAARGAGMLTATVTNGRASAADPRLLDFMDEVVVSLDSLRPEVNDRQRGPGAFAAAMRTIDIALERRLKTYVNMALTRHNLEELEAMLEFCERKGMKMNAQSIKFGVLYYDEAARQMALTPDQIRGVHRKLAEWSRQRRAVLFSARAYRKVLSWPDPCVNTVQSQGYSQCVAGDCYVHINPNGDVVPCIPATTGITPKNIVKDGLTEALKHTRRHHCGDCWSAYLNERKLLFGLHPAALMEYLRRG